ncbi:hypothetical protein EMGBD4_10960 [Verrucomicrobiota bacterium]|nr:hypothetical protein EMGBD4_10960 [Verrucomicrobiota bacterium]
MREHDVLRREVAGEVQQLLAVGVAAQVEALDLGPQDGGVVEALELEFAAGRHADQFATGSFRVAIAHEEHRVLGVVKDVGRDAPSRGFLH